MKPILAYRKFILAALLVGVMICAVEKASPLTAGLGFGDWRKTLTATVLVSGAILIVTWLTAVFWKKLGYLRIEGDFVYFIGNEIPLQIITPAILYTLLWDQIINVALPEEMIYRGYFQSRMNFSYGPVISISSSTLLFALVHIDRPLMLVHLMIIGPLYGWAYHYSKSIFPSVIAHCLSNLIGLLIIGHIAAN